MKIKHNNDRKSSRGYIYVASRDKKYYEQAIYSCRSLKDYYPDAHVTLFTHECFVDGDDDALIFDTIITGIPTHYRSKLWCLPRTPYERTIYIDCDSLIAHRDIKNMHDLIDESDIAFGPSFAYTTSNFKWAYLDKAMTEIPRYHGSVCIYNNKPETLEFMQTWFDEYYKQITSPWPYEENHYKEWRIFDMFTLWRMTCGKFPEFDRFNKLRITQFPPRYNITVQHHPEHKTDRYVIVQVDPNAWEAMTDIWTNIQRKLKNAKYTFKQRSPSDPVIEFD